MNKNMEFSTEDFKFMKTALRLAGKGLGFTEPNPMVGAVVVKQGKILATGYHRLCGKEHAEQMALKNLSETGTTLYVSLEPCLHFGKTPPCTDMIVEKRVKRVVAAVADPNPEINGRGFEKLIQQGINVEYGLLKDEAVRLNRHYFKFMEKQKTYITINAGISIDGKLSDKFRSSQWITSEELRQYSHSLRGEFGAILAGSKTVAEDNARLTVREKEWVPKKMFRVVLDSKNSLNPGLEIFTDQDNFPLIIFSAKNISNKEPKVKNHYFIDSGPDGLVLEEVLEQLYRLGIASVLIEGGGQVINSFLKKGLYDEFVLFVADKIIGGETSVELFPEGAALSKSVVLHQREILEFKDGFIIRGFRSCLPE